MNCFQARYHEFTNAGSGWYGCGLAIAENGGASLRSNTSLNSRETDLEGHPFFITITLGKYTSLRNKGFGLFQKCRLCMWLYGAVTGGRRNFVPEYAR